MKKRRWLFTLRARLSLCMLVVVLATIIALSARFYRIARDMFSDVTAKNILSTMENTLELTDQRYERIEAATLEMLGNREVYDMLSDIASGGVSAYIRNAAALREALQGNFSSLKDVMKADILAGPYAISYAKYSALRYVALSGTDAWEEIQSRRGGAVWLARREVAPRGADESYAGAVWHARALNMIDLNTYRTLYGLRDEKPVLLLCVRGGEFREALLADIAQEGAGYALLGTGGAALEGDEDIAAALLSGGEPEGASGIARVRIDDRDVMILYAKSRVTGWIHSVALNPDVLAERILDDISRGVLWAAGALLVAMLATTALMSRAMSRTAEALITGMREMEDGRFGLPIRFSAHDDFGYLIERFNGMNDRIRKLIDENYRVQIREKDAEIAMLNVQFNPHYLYNTLNAIHWAISLGEARKADRMILALSSMLRYTSDGKCEWATLREDVDWLKKYVELMGMRYENGVEVSWAIAEEMLDERIPKLILQPFVENSLVHGLRDRESGGRIDISARAEGDMLIFEVADNGAGLSPRAIEALDAEGGRVSGIRAVRRRVELLYGGRGIVELKPNDGGGARAAIRIPKQSPTN